MSHVDTGTNRFQDDAATLEALPDACRELGLEFVRGRTGFRWYGSWLQDWAADSAAYKNGIPPADYGKCAHVIRFPLPAGMRPDDPGRPYEMGLYRLPDGALVPVMDTWTGGPRAAELAEALGMVRAADGTVSFQKLAGGVAKWKALHLAGRLGGREVRSVVTTPDGKTVIRIGVKPAGIVHARV